MNVGYVGYLDPYEFNGGGEINLRDVISFGRSIGHNIEILAVKGKRINQERFLANKDFFFLADVYNCFTHPHFFRDQLLEKIIKHHPYLHYDNSYVDICNLEYFPCHGLNIGEECKFKKGRVDARRFVASVQKTGFSNAIKDRRFCFSRSTEEVYKNSILNVFVSPLHKDKVESRIGKSNIGRFYIALQKFDTQIFRDLNGIRDIENLFVGPIVKAKGIENIIREYPQGNITLIGNLTDMNYADYGNQVGYIQQEELGSYYNRAKNFIHLPEWPEPLGRGVIEAALCGCNLILNENVGARSLGFELGDSRNYKESMLLLWEEIHSVFKAL
jgi:glycosyltransferase involved in cell wall biosynthesis